MAGEKTFGQTPPLSLALPSEAEKRSNDALVQELRDQGTFETPPETQKRFGPPSTTTREDLG
jgi:poly(A) polymerase